GMLLGEALEIVSGNGLTTKLCAQFIHEIAEGFFASTALQNISQHVNDPDTLIRKNAIVSGRRIGLVKPESNRYRPEAFVTLPFGRDFQKLSPGLIEDLWIRCSQRVVAQPFDNPLVSITRGSDGIRGSRRSYAIFLDSLFEAKTKTHLRAGA